MDINGLYKKRGKKSLILVNYQFLKFNYKKMIDYGSKYKKKTKIYCNENIVFEMYKKIIN